MSYRPSSPAYDSKKEGCVIANWYVTSSHPVLTPEEREKWHEEIRQAMIRVMIADEKKKAEAARKKGI